MSSGFVSGGTADAPVERSDEWLAAQDELEANRRRKAEESRQASGRSLYETLEANKVAKQEAFEEANKLKNQFRALDQDEVEFLDSVLERTRADEERVKRETAEGLESFRKLQEEADKKLLEAAQSGDVIGPVVEDDEEWVADTVGRKRKRKEKGGLKGVKIRRASTSESGASNVKLLSAQTGGKASSQKIGEGASKTGKEIVTTAAEPLSNPKLGSKSTATPQFQNRAAASPVPSGLGLVDYRSDSDDE